MVLWETEIALKIPFLMTTKAMFNTIEINHLQRSVAELLSGLQEYTTKIVPSTSCSP